MKRYTAILLSLLSFLMIFLACNKNEESYTEREIPDYEDNIGNDELFLNGFSEPRKLTLEQFQYIADCGLNYIIIDPWLNGTVPDSAEMVTALNLCEQVGIKAFIMLNNTHDIKTENGEVLKSFSEFTTDYSEFPAFAGYSAFDEPTRAQFDWIADDYLLWEEAYPDHTYFVNLMYGDGAGTAEDYLKLYNEKIMSKFPEGKKYVSYDRYPLYWNVRDNYAYAYYDWLKGLEDMSRLATQNNARLYTYIQTLGYDYGSRRAPTAVEDIRYQCAVNMAYGSKGMQCFLYSTLNNPGFEEAMVTASGERTDIYYFVQQTFTELKKWQHVYLSFDYKGTIVYDSDIFTYNPDDCIATLQYSLSQHERINSYTAKRDLLIGCFKDKDGYDGFLMTTFNDPYYQKDNDISIKFNNAKKALIYLNGEKQIVDLDQGVLNWCLEAGDSLFVIPC